MDNGLVPTMANVTINGLDGVLILVVVDNGLVHQILNFYKVESIRLNPCCSGQWSRTSIKTAHYFSINCLNPCCSGQWSRTGLSHAKRIAKSVLILVVVDNGLVLYYDQF